jgi:hypothetical protein
MLVLFYLSQQATLGRDLTNDKRMGQSATLLIWLLWAWVVMTLCHELGHVVAGTVGGATLTQLELRPWRLPHSLFAGDQNPLITLWAGPVLGCGIPLLVAAIARRPACWFVAWFCVVANASYLLLGYFSGDAELDSTKMIRAGTPPIVLLGVTVVTLPLGYTRFRRSCIDVMSDIGPAMSRRGRRISAAGLVAVLVIQSAIGVLIPAQL